MLFSKSSKIQQHAVDLLETRCIHTTTLSNAEPPTARCHRQLRGSPDGARVGGLNSRSDSPEGWDPGGGGVIWHGGWLEGGSSCGSSGELPGERRPGDGSDGWSGARWSADGLRSCSATSETDTVSAARLTHRSAVFDNQASYWPLRADRHRPPVPPRHLLETLTSLSFSHHTHPHPPTHPHTHTLCYFCWRHSLTKYSKWCPKLFLTTIHFWPKYHSIAFVKFFLCFPNM